MCSEILCCLDIVHVSLFSHKKNLLYSINLSIYSLVIFLYFPRRAKIIRAGNGSAPSANSNLVNGKVSDETTTSQAPSSTLGPGKLGEVLYIFLSLYAY